MSKTFPEHPEARLLEDTAWRLKDLAADAHARAMSGPLRSALQRATRDTQRVYEALHAELHKRKREAKAEEQSSHGETQEHVWTCPRHGAQRGPSCMQCANGADAPAQQELGGDHG